MAPFADIKNSC